MPQYFDRRLQPTCILRIVAQDYSCEEYKDYLFLFWCSELSRLEACLVKLDSG